MARVAERGQVPLLVGGTGLYFRALQQGLSELPEADAAVRERIAGEAAVVGWSALHARMAAADPEAGERIKPADAQRIQRALEVMELTGRPISELQRRARRVFPWRVLKLALLPEARAILHERIAGRFDQMIGEGLLDEVRALRARGGLHADLPAIRAVGYRQAWEYLDGQGDATDFRDRGIYATRQLAKRQITWLRSELDARTFDPDRANPLSEAASARRGEEEMSKGQSLQDPFLNALRRERVPVAIYLVNGIKLQGTIESFDQFVVLLRNQVSQMVYKHAISTVVPSRNVRVGGHENHPEQKKGDRAILVLPHSRGEGDAIRRGEEFAELVTSAGAEVLTSISARVESPNPRFYIGSGKADEVAEAVRALEADLVLVDHELTPVQERNLEKHLKTRVVDRAGLILDIFAQRARSHEGKLEVELAQLKHIATRLVRGWTHLDAQRGGAIGNRGPGETQLETDRRLLAERVKMLTKRLEKVQVQRDQQRRARLRNTVPRVALVGYTNAGKSTLFNALTTGGVYAADQLFATLDPTVRKIDGLSCGPAVIADTVGFIRELPHDLVAAFRATLAEARDADLLIHVSDAADEERELLRRVVDEVLEEIGAGDVPQLSVMNKIDLVDAEARVDRGDDGRPRQVWLSAHSGEGLDGLREALGELLGGDRIRTGLELPLTAGRLHARLKAAGAIAGEAVDEHG
ncbi:hypothetical protein KCV01_g19304, partial [Aureobasidium melanogenum]